MICFHFTIFVVLETTRRMECPFFVRLWFAFILLSLSYWKQRGVGQSPTQQVVICFHFTIFVVLETTHTQLISLFSLLWFAFILLSLSYWKQQKGRAEPYPTSCDLLSFYYLCRTGNNDTPFWGLLAWLWFAFILLSLSYWKQQRDGLLTDMLVVICFHFTIFVVLETTQEKMPYRK